MKKIRRILSALALGSLCAPGWSTPAYAAGSVMRYLSSENYVRQGDLVIGLHLDADGQFEIVVLNLKTNKIYPVMLNEEPAGNLGRDFLGSGMPNFNALYYRSLKQLFFTLYDGDPTFKWCHQYQLNWDAETNSYLVQNFKVGDSYPNYTRVRCK